VVAGFPAVTSGIDLVYLFMQVLDMPVVVIVDRAGLDLVYSLVEAETQSIS
jgi:hypothetical protein